MNKPESFEVTEYGEDESGYEKFAAIKQIVADLPKKNPAFAVSCKLAGNVLTLQYHCYEMHLSDIQRLRAVADQADQVFKETLKHLKKEFKAATKSNLDLKELKDKANHSCDKVSLNQRYHYLAWRVYELG